MATSLSQVVETPGTCFLCGCTEGDPCIVPNGDACSWASPEKTVCSACVVWFGQLVVGQLGEVCGTRADQQAQAEPSRIVLP
jgi:hypothetical protein